MSDVWTDIKTERKRQVQKGYTREHDDAHRVYDFALYVNIRTFRIMSGANDRQLFVEIAALAVAAAESMDRRGVS